MRELQKEHEGDVEVELIAIRSERGQAASKRYDFGESRHGLVALDGAGEFLFLMPGHSYKKADIEAKLGPFLPEESEASPGAAEPPAEEAGEEPGEETEETEPDEDSPAPD